MKRLIIGITGASGVIYGIRLLEALKNTEVETHLILSSAGALNIGIETGFDIGYVKSLADVHYSNKDIAAAIASGSFLATGMVVAPCTVKTLSGIANSFTDNLMIRAADVQLKERRKLALLFRESPLHKGHLRLLSHVCDMGAQIYPPAPAFYHGPETIDDIVNQSVGKLLDYFEISHDLFKRWDNTHIQKKEKPSRS